MRELKLWLDDTDGRGVARRTPPGVRELKRERGVSRKGLHGRTPPGVRELKPYIIGEVLVVSLVAPLPGCVN